MYLGFCFLFNIPIPSPRKAIVSRCVNATKHTFFGVVSPLALFDFGQIPLCNVHLLPRFSTIKTII